MNMILPGTSPKASVDRYSNRPKTQTRETSTHSDPAPGQRFKDDFRRQITTEQFLDNLSGKQPVSKEPEQPRTLPGKSEHRFGLKNLAMKLVAFGRSILHQTGVALGLIKIDLSEKQLREFQFTSSDKVVKLFLKDRLTPESAERVLREVRAASSKISEDLLQSISATPSARQLLQESRQLCETIFLDREEYGKNDVSYIDQDRLERLELTAILYPAYHDYINRALTPSSEE